MAKSKISSQDFLDLLDEQNEHPTETWSSPIPKKPTGEVISAHDPKNKTVSKVVANNKQTVSKVVANNKQTVSKVVANLKTEINSNTETVSATVSSSVSKVVANNKQTVSKVVAELPISTLVGLQRVILFFIYNECQINRSEISPPLTLEHIAINCQSTVKTVKNAIYRLTQKLFLSRETFKDGRGGWTQYKLSKSVFQDILHYETVSKVVANNKQTVSKVVAKPEAQPEAAVPSSSSIVLNKEFKTTTTGELDKNDLETSSLSFEWQQVDLNPLTGIGFTQTHLAQIARAAKLTPDEVQDSIFYFAFDLSRNGKGRTLNGSPLNFFMGILRKGIPYAPPENYESPAEEARRRIREFKLRREQELKAEEQQIVDLEFFEWKRGLGTGELAQLLPEFALRPGPLQDSTLRTYFETKVWPEKNQKNSIEDRNEVIRQIEQSLGE